MTCRDVQERSCVAVASQSHLSFNEWKGGFGGSFGSGGPKPKAGSKRSASAAIPNADLVGDAKNGDVVSSLSLFTPRTIAKRQKTRDSRYSGI